MLIVFLGACLVVSYVWFGSFDVADLNVDPVDPVATHDGAPAVVSPDGAGARVPDVKSPVAPSRRSVAADDAARYAMQLRLTKFYEFDGVADASLPIGYVRVPRFSPGTRTGDDGLLHIIFSSGCNNFQHWQSEQVLTTARLVGQRGRITRIVSGCHDKRAESIGHRHQTFPAGKNDQLVPLDVLNRSVNDEFGLFVTPPFEGAIDFPWINKPSSIRYFMEHARPELDRAGETIIAILDPDFIYLRPLTQLGERRDAILQSGLSASPLASASKLDVAEKGRPVAQRYGLGSGWVSKFDVKKIVGEETTPAARYSHASAGTYFPAGPPYMLHVDDLFDLSSLWSKYMKPILEVEKDILADMWAYCIAAAHLGLKHTLLDHYMISNAGAGGEGWLWIDAWPDKQMSCNDPNASVAVASAAGQSVRWPTFIHLASNSKAPAMNWPDEWMFHKGHVPGDIMDCSTPLIRDAPDDTWQVSPSGSGNPSKRAAFIMCNAVATLNRMLVLYKTKFCPGGKFERRKLVRLIQGKRKDVGCNAVRDRWCWPLAQIEGLPDDWRAQGQGPLLT